MRQAAPNKVQNYAVLQQLIQHFNNFRAQSGKIFSVPTVASTRVFCFVLKFCQRVKSRGKSFGFCIVLQTH